MAVESVGADEEDFVLYRVAAVELTRGAIARRYSYTVVVMQYYPRFLPKDWVDEYVRELAPDRALFTEFKEKARELKDHNEAFEAVDYPRRFQISPAGTEHLARLSEMSRGRDVFLVCNCKSLEFCHADLLLITARHHFDADVQTPRMKYPTFEPRLTLEGTPYLLQTP